MSRRPADVRLDELLRTAVDVIVERGLANTRTGDVARAAGVSQALVFYHFANKDALLAQAFAYAASRDLEGLDQVASSDLPAPEKVRQIIDLYAPAGRSKAWALWIDGWSEALRNPTLEAVSRRLDLRWKEALAEAISAGVANGAFTCADPVKAAWRITSLIDGLAVQLTVHPDVLDRSTVLNWIAEAVATELGLAAGSGFSVES
ncbi:MAG: TetR family transcriptional regulator [Kribbellaceae bacterium]|nr:TetR family transcriptional regulator [Kribbellaceae bacterium]